MYCQLVNMKIYSLNENIFLLSSWWYILISHVFTYKKSFLPHYTQFLHIKEGLVRVKVIQEHIKCENNSLAMSRNE